jgi:hypothetical protein
VFRYLLCPHDAIVALFLMTIKGDFMTSTELLSWIAFNLFVLAMLALDLGVFHRKALPAGVA